MKPDSQSSGRQAARAQLADWFRHLGTPLRRLISRRRRLASADLDDVAQEVYLRLLRYDRAELVEDPRAYLFRVATNVASEWSMRARERLPHAACWLDDLVDEFDALDDTERDCREDEVRKAVEELAPRTREILKLRFAANLSNAAIAERLQVTLRIVRRDLAQAYVHLRMKLAPLQNDRRRSAGLMERP